MQQEIYKTLNQYKKELEKQGYDVLYIGLYGSQNYNLHDEHSDIDARAVVLPSVKTLLQGGSISTKVEFDNGEVDIKDTISFAQNAFKGNPAFIECIETKYFIGDKTFRGFFKDVKVNPKAVLGMMHQKKKALEKGLARNAPTLETHGYDTKQIHHIVRLKDVFSKACVEYGGKEREVMLDIKRNGAGSLEEVLSMAGGLIELKSKVLEDWTKLEIPKELYEYVEIKMIEKMLVPNETLNARQHRVFNGNVPKVDKRMFPYLEDKDGTDITYVVYSYLEVM